VELWWAASTHPALLANAVPTIPYAASSVPGRDPTKAKPVKKRKAKQKQDMSHASDRSLLSTMSNNIRILKRVRRAHSKLAALAVMDDPNGEGAEELAAPTFALAAETEGADVVDDTPWRPLDSSASSRYTRHVSQQEAEDCLRWTSGRVVEHAGFQGTSRMALDVLGSVVGDYLLNVGRTLRFMVDKHSKTMTSEVSYVHGNS
jgi:transcriptional activator SPT7